MDSASLLSCRQFVEELQTSLDHRMKEQLQNAMLQVDANDATSQPGMQLTTLLSTQEMAQLKEQARHLDEIMQDLDLVQDTPSHDADQKEYERLQKALKEKNVTIVNMVQNLKDIQSQLIAILSMDEVLGKTSAS